MPPNAKRFKLISCEIFYREMCYSVARSPHCVDIEFLPKGLHDVGTSKMQSHLSDVLGRIDASNYDAILVGYGLCNNGILGLQASSVPLVFPRAHDCISLFLGSKERYQELFHQNPGVYYETTGWLERGQNGSESLRPWTMASCYGWDMTFDDMVAKYGEENAAYLLEQLGDLTRNYSKGIFIEMGIEPDDRFEQMARNKAEKNHWAFEKIRGNMRLFQKLVDGDWNEEEFLVVPPGEQVSATYNETIISREKIKS